MEEVMRAGIDGIQLFVVLVVGCMMVLTRVQRCAPKV
jgi:hypothetical protein